MTSDEIVDQHVHNYRDMEELRTRAPHLFKCFAKLHDQGLAFMKSYQFVREVKKCYFIAGIDEKALLCLYEITSDFPDVPRYHWVVTGDLPPAYLFVEDNYSPGDALEGYAYEMRRWIDAVREGRLQDIDELIPVNGAPTIANADSLQWRLEFLEEHCLEGLKEMPPLGPLNP